MLTNEEKTRLTPDEIRLVEVWRRTAATEGTLQTIANELGMTRGNLRQHARIVGRLVTLPTLDEAARRHKAVQRAASTVKEVTP